MSESNCGTARRGDETPSRLTVIQLLQQASLLQTGKVTGKSRNIKRLKKRYCVPIDTVCDSFRRRCEAADTRKEWRRAPGTGLKSVAKDDRGMAAQHAGLAQGVSDPPRAPACPRPTGTNERNEKAPSR
jgi:hypothetical protein